MGFNGTYKSFRMKNGQFWIGLLDHTNFECVLGYVHYKCNTYERYQKVMAKIARHEVDYFERVCSYEELMNMTPHFLESEIIVKVDRSCRCVSESDLLEKRWMVLETEVSGLSPFRADEEETRVIGKELSYANALWCARGYALMSPGKKHVLRPTGFGNFKEEGHDCWRDCDCLDFHA